MTLECKIHRDSSDKIEWVEARNGSRSKLFDALVQMTDSKEAAMGFYELTYTDGFNDWSTDYYDVTEPTPEKVFDYFRFLKYGNTKLNRLEILDVFTQVQVSDRGSITEYANELNTLFYKNGKFIVDKGRLEKSGLYTDLEIDRISGDPSVQEKLDRAIYQLNNSLEYIEDLTLGDSDLFLKRTGELGVLGNFKREFDDAFYKKVNNELTGVSGSYELGNIIIQNFSGTRLSDRYFSDSAFAEELLLKYSTQHSIPEYTIIEDKLERRLDNEGVDTLQEVILVSGNYKGVVDVINIIDALDETTYNSNIDAVKTVLKSLSNKLVTFNLDYTGLDNLIMTTSLSDMKTHLNYLKGFLTGLVYNSVSTSDINKLVEKRAELYGEVAVPTSKLVSRESIGKHNLYLRTGVDPITLFEKFSLLKIKDSIYRKVATDMSYGDIVDKVIELTRKGGNILPSEAFYPSAVTTKGNVSTLKLLDENNLNNVRRDITRYVDKRVHTLSNYFNGSIDTLRRYVISKEILNISENEFSTIDVDNFESRLANFNGNQEYLTTDFVSDLYKEKLKQKALDSFVYRNFYKYLSFDSKGVSISNNSDFVVNSMRLTKPSNKLISNLQQYSLINRDSNLNELFKVKPATFQNRPLFLKSLYANNPYTVTEYKGEMRKEGDLYVGEFTANYFVRRGNKMYEQIGSNNSESFFKEFAVNDDSTYFLLNMSLEKNKKSVSTSTKQAEEQVSISNMYSNAESDRIDAEMNKCDG